MENKLTLKYATSSIERSNYYSIKSECDYLEYVKGTAKDIIEDAIDRLKADSFIENSEYTGSKYMKDLIQECISSNDMVTEHIDSEGIIIYYHGHEIIMEYTDNADYLTENVGLGGGLLTNWAQTREYFAYWAFYADVMDALCEEYEVIPCNY